VRNFQLLASGLDVQPLLHAIQRQPALWNTHKFRTSYERTPHGAVDDIWLRYSPDAAAFTEVLEDTAPVWHAEAQALPQARPLVLGVMGYLGAYSLERLLITRLAPGRSILPHADTDGAYGNMPDLARYHVVLQGLPGSLFHCGDETVCMQTGELYWFDASIAHSCENASADDRIHLLVDCRIWS
jgi:hypothetical protein